MRLRILLLLASLVLTACQRGPDSGVLRQELQDRLDTEFSPGLFQVSRFERKGSAPAPEHDDGVYVYYGAELEFQRDYQLTAWQGLNLGTLAVVVGATPAGIEGYHRNNRQGDRLLVRGRLNYHRNGDRWEAIHRMPDKKVVEPADRESVAGSGPLAVLESVRRLLQRAPASAGRSRDDIIVAGFSDALRQIDLRFARLDGRLTFGTGWKGGTYQLFGAAFARYATQQGLPVFNYSSEGSLENGLNLQKGYLDFALLQSDVAEVLYQGWSEAAQLPQPDLRSMASLWPEALHIVTLEDRGIRSFADLKGKRLAVGSPGSGTRFTARRVWEAAGYTLPETERIRGMGLAESFAALESGEVDAVFLAGAVPDPTLQRLAQQRDDIRFVPIDTATLDKLTSHHFSYYNTVIAAKTYPGQSEPFPTLGFAALLITSKRTSEDAVERFLDLVVSSANQLTHEFYRAGFISPGTSRMGISIPMHPGATHFYERLADKSDDK
ncbi:MAG TPA: TAXI family TRAP transporter solute-binding subunit [Gammaproteobacteria bacterium]|nr:TAXI family TRAP transporter solute-binding subunit [Gammaproteobacteria bacterium]